MEKRNVVVDLGGTQVRVALTDGLPRLIGKRDERTHHERSAPGVIDQIVRMANGALADAGIGWDAIGCMAVASPGPLDPRTGAVFSPPNMPGWATVELGGEISRQIGVPVRVANDASAAAMGEFRYGAGRGKRNFVYLTVSTGIGGGVVVDGALMEGSFGAAGEIGHMSIDRHGPPCPCGSTGCLEMFASGTGIARGFRERLASDSHAPTRARGKPATAADIARAAEAGDRLARLVFTDSAEALGLGVVNCIHIFDPDVVALGGGVSKSGALLFDAVNRMVERHIMPVPGREVRAIPAELGQDVGLIGAGVIGEEFLSGREK